MKNTWTPSGSIEWCWLQLGATSSMLQQHAKENSEHAKKFLENKKGIGVSICFICLDAIALYHEFRSREIDASEPFVGNGLWVTGVTDPDGYQLFFESETDVREETTYSDWTATK